MTNQIGMFDKVALTEDQESSGLYRGMVGSVVEIYNQGEAYEVEFIDRDGKTYAVETIEATKLLKLIYQPT